MSELFIYNQKVESIFQLLGEKENNISYSVGYALANCRVFLEKFLQRAGVLEIRDKNKIQILLQSFEREGGFTDFEIKLENEFHIIIEAKRGWVFPDNEQLEKYALRSSFYKSRAKIKRIIVLNESIPSFTKARFPYTEIKEVPVEVISWKEIMDIIAISRSTGLDSENRFLKELHTYLSEIITMQKKDTNWVYVVSLGAGTPDGWSISWQDIVNSSNKYFHPIGGTVGGWPPEPPNYIAFRYNGKLQSIHHIDKYEVFNDPSVHFSSIPSDEWADHYLYHLGRPMKPHHEVKAGKKIVRSMRVWAMLDLLLTCDTIEEARDLSHAR